jgi:alanyl-tRNA synthetase
VLGTHVKQSGSSVDARRLRFDFSHMKKLSDRELGRVEEMVNGWVADSLRVAKEVKPLEAARAEGALSFFGDKYGDTVRVVSVGGVSREFCGGTHVDNTGEIGLIKITGESAVASGIRRIEAVTGDTAVAWIKDTLGGLLRKIREGRSGEGPFPGRDVEGAADAVVSGRTKINGAVIRDIDERIKPALTAELAEIEKSARKRRKDDDAGAFNRIKGEMDALAAAAPGFGGIRFASGIVEGADMQLLRKAAGYLEKRMERSVILLGAGSEEKAYLICALTPDIAGTDIDARSLVESVSSHIGGSGGGKQTFAQAGGKTPEGLASAIAGAAEILKKRGTA